MFLTEVPETHTGFAEEAIREFNATQNKHTYSLREGAVHVSGRPSITSLREFWQVYDKHCNSAVRPGSSK